MQIGDESGTNDSQAGVFQEYSNNYLGIYVRMNEGEVILEYDDSKRPESYYESYYNYEHMSQRPVEGLSGNCIGVFVGDIGQDVNPVLYMQMEDGSVEILSIFNAIEKYDWLSSGRMEGLENIVYF